MSTLKAVNLQHPSSSTVNATLTSGGLLTGAGMDLIASSTVTSTSSVSINNCFTSAYDNYLLSIDVSAIASQQLLGVRLRASGVDLSSGVYDRQRGYFNSTTASGQRDLSQTEAVGMYSVAGGSVLVQVLSPALARNTKVLSQYVDTGAPLFDSYSTIVRNTNAYDGITVFAPIVWSGAVRVYGLRNA